MDGENFFSETQSAETSALKFSEFFFLNEMQGKIIFFHWPESEIIFFFKIGSEIFFFWKNDTLPQKLNGRCLMNIHSTKKNVFFKWNWIDVTTTESIKSNTYRYTSIEIIAFSISICMFFIDL